MATRIADRGVGYEEIFAWHAAGDIVLCYRCQTPLRIVMTTGESRAAQRVAGVYCEKNPAHMQIVLHRSITKKTDER